MYDIYAILPPSFIKIYPVVAENSLPVPKSTQIRAMLKLLAFWRFSKTFLLQPRQIQYSLVIVKSYMRNRLVPKLTSTFV